MPWFNGNYPPSYKNQPKKIRDKATEIANEVLKTTHNEGEAIATGLKQAGYILRRKNQKKKLEFAELFPGSGSWPANHCPWRNRVKGECLPLTEWTFLPRCWRVTFLWWWSRGMAGLWVRRLSSSRWLEHFRFSSYLVCALPGLSRYADRYCRPPARRQVK